MSIAILNNERLQKLFYFSLKRTGSRENAEDLSQSIVLEILHSHAKGYSPDNFDAWMWTIARRKYAQWVKEKHSRTTAFDPNHVSDIWDIACPVHLEEDLVKEEELSLLRRELSLLSREYRDITVAYYIDNRKVSDIAKTAHLPEGTIKRKLYESRKYLKEGMQMARTYGKRSYAPEDITFIINRSSTTDNVPYSLVQSLLSKNILLEAYTNPCTIEELSIALGVASPYLEEEISKLVEGQLLKKLSDGRYETDIIILDKETQQELFQKAEETVCKLAKHIMCLVSYDSSLPILIETKSLKQANLFLSEAGKLYMKEKAAELYLDIEKPDDREKALVEKEYSQALSCWQNKTGNKTLAGALSSEELLWFYFLKTIRDLLFIGAVKNGAPGEFDKNYKGVWSMIGLEAWENPLSDYLVGLDIDNWNSRNGAILLKFYISGIHNICRAKPTPEEADLIADIIRNDKEMHILTDSERDIITHMLVKKLVVIDNNKILPAFPVIFTAGLEQLNEIIHTTSAPEKYKYLNNSAVMDVNAVLSLCNTAIGELYEYYKDKIYKGLPKHLEPQVKTAAKEMLTSFQSHMLKYALDHGYLKIPDNPEKVPLGVGLYITQ